MHIEIQSDFTNANLDEMKEIYLSVGWMKHTNEIIRQVFEASNVVALVKANGRIIGIGRGMTDGVFNAAIYDVVVHRDFQGQGMAKKIVEFLLDRLSNISCTYKLYFVYPFIHPWASGLFPHLSAMNTATRKMSVQISL